MSQSKRIRQVHIKVSDLVKIYRTGDISVHALKGVDLEVRPGEIIAIMGPSGSGKTTLLNLIGGIDKPTAGSILVNGVDITKYSESRLRLYRLYTVGYIFQFFNLVPTLTVLENIVLPMLIAGWEKKKAIERAKELLKEVDLFGKENRFPEELSGGERQRVAVAVALANDPPLILADEPTGELDIVNAEKVVSLLVNLARNGKTIVVSTHDPRVARMTDRIYMLEDGRIIGVYTPERLSGGTAISEIGLERQIIDYLKKRISGLQDELKELEKLFREGKISAEEFISKYNRVRETIDLLKDEIARLGAGVEV